MSVFGPLVTDTRVEDLILAQLKLWLPSYLGEVGDVTGRERTDMPDIRSWGTPAADLQHRPEQTTPHLALLSNGLSDMREAGDGYYSGVLKLEVTVIVSANSFYATDRLSKAYATAVEVCLLQKPVGAPVNRVEFTGHSPDDLPTLPNSDRSMIAITSRFDVHVDDMFNRRRGPVEPVPQEEPRDPYPELTPAASYDITVEPTDE